VVLEDAQILIHEKKIANMRTCCRSSSRSPKSGKPLLIIAEDIEARRWPRWWLNKMRGTLHAAASRPGIR